MPKIRESVLAQIVYLSMMVFVFLPYFAAIAVIFITRYNESTNVQLSILAAAFVAGVLGVYICVRKIEKVFLKQMEGPQEPSKQ